jgi:hypothetical protein
MTCSITCTPREGYVAIRYNHETKERDEDNRYVFVKKTGTDELWLVCMRGDNAGEALKESEVNADEWMVDEFYNWDEIIEVYYADFGGFGNNKIGPLSLDFLAEEIAERIRSAYDNEVEPSITMKQMTSEEFQRQSNAWNSVYDTLRDNPEKFVEKFQKKQEDAVKR